MRCRPSLIKASLVFLVTLLPQAPDAAIIKHGEFHGTPRGYEICATRYDQFQLTKRLRTLQLYFDPDSVTGYVNQTQGSYFEIDTRNQAIAITFLTSGLFDLNLIRRSGAMMFCDDGQNLRAKGIDRDDQVTLLNGTITFGRGGSTLTFRRGEKPDLLRKLEED